MNEVRLDKDVIREAFEKFKEFEKIGAHSEFTHDDYMILFQAGYFEYGAKAERFCRAIYKHGPIPTF